MALKQTPSQTVGPFFAYGLTAPQYGYAFGGIAGSAIAGEATEGRRIRIVGQVFDGTGEAVLDAMIEVWQANAAGRYAHPADPRRDNLDPAFKGFGRFGTGTDPQRRFIFDTVKPGALGDGQAPHISLIVTARGVPNHLYTRLYFPDEAEANSHDPVLSSVPASRRDTLIAAFAAEPGGAVYRFDIHLQGPHETVFFDI
ncbi:MAG: protocatechuate 3,4-dioxygenase subunit alpha [Alphaproteobacteria bacterium]